MFIKRGFKRTFLAIQKYKGLILLLIVLQLAFLVSISFVSLQYQEKIFINMENILNPLQDGNYNANTVEAGLPLLQEIAPVIENYRLLKENIQIMLLWFGALFLVLHGGTWVLVHQILDRKAKAIGQQWLKFVASSIALAVPFLLICYYFLKSQITSAMEPALVADSARNLLYAGIAIYYLMLVSYAFIDIKNWKNFIRTVFTSGIKNIHWTLLTLLITLVFIFLGLLAVYVTVLLENVFFLSVVGVLIFILLLVFSQLLWVACLYEKSNY